MEIICLFDLIYISNKNENLQILVKCIKVFNINYIDDKFNDYFKKLKIENTFENI